MKTLIFTTALFFSSISFAQKKQNTATQQNGRFQLIQLSDMRRDQYLLDTQTGKIWVGTCGVSDKNGNCAYNLWAPQDVVGINITFPEYLDKIERFEKIVKEDSK